MLIYRHLTILTKRLILDAWLGSGCASADGYITVLKIPMKLCKDGRQVIILTNYFHLRHKPNIKTTITSICTVPFSRIFL